jgi:hypothetical protein
MRKALLIFALGRSLRSAGGMADDGVLHSIGVAHQRLFSALNQLQRRDKDLEQRPYTLMTTISNKSDPIQQLRLHADGLASIVLLSSSSWQSPSYQSETCPFCRNPTSHQLANVRGASSVLARYCGLQP